jgi:2-hydroxychromene-2-carboxylate isomerase
MSDPQRRRLEFWFEFASTYSYPASQRIVGLAENAGVEIVWRPFLLGPIFKKQGWNDSPFNLFPVKGQYMWRDLERTCGELGLLFRRPSVFPRNGLLAARLASAFRGEPWIASLVPAIYRANFAQDRDIADPAVLRSILVEIGRDPDVLAATDEPAVKDDLRAQTERAITLSIFGAPSFVVNEELFWGNDRLETAIAWARRGKA